MREFNGCTFMDASAEFGRPDNPIHCSCAEHKHLVQGYLSEPAAAAGAAAPERLAGQLMLLMEGAIVVRHTACRRDVAKTARGAAEILIERALD